MTLRELEKRIKEIWNQEQDILLVNCRSRLSSGVLTRTLFLSWCAWKQCIVSATSLTVETWYSSNEVVSCLSCGQPSVDTKSRVLTSANIFQCCRSLCLFCPIFISSLFKKTETLFWFCILLRRKTRQIATVIKEIKLSQRFKWFQRGFISINLF